MVSFDDPVVPAVPEDMLEPVPLLLLVFLCGFVLALLCAPEPAAVDPALPFDMVPMELSPVVSDPMLPGIDPVVVPLVVGGVVEPDMPPELDVEPLVDPGMLPALVD